MEKIFYRALFLLFFLSISGLSSSLRAQSSDYPYTEFRFQGIDRQALELEAGLGAWFSPTPSSSLSHYGFHNNIQASYIRLRNLEKIQTFERYSVGESFFTSRLHGKGTNIDTRFSNLQSSAQAYREYRYYYKPNRFFEYRLSGQAGFSFADVNDAILNTRMDLKAGSAQGSVGLFTGWGRLEPIDDVFLAKFTLDGMQAAGLITDELSQEQVFSLGQHMARIRNQHSFNFRRQRSYELEQLDAWFREHTDIDPGSMSFLAVLKDNWLYGLQNTRFSGWRISVGLEPELYWQQLVRPNSEGSAQLNYTLGGVAEYHRPINQFWQREHQVSMGVNHFLYSTYVPGIQWDFGLFLKASTGYSWHPNTRTRISSRGIVSYSPTIDPENSSPAFMNQFTSSLQFEAEYLLNYRMRVSGFTQLNQTFFEIFNDFSMSGGVRFTYNIF